jgi:hypothetical protein
MDAPENRSVTLISPARSPSRATEAFCALLCGCAGLISIPASGLAGSARDYLNAPIDTWMTFYNAGYFTSVTPEDGLDGTSSVRANVLAQSVVITRTFDLGGRTSGISAILPYAALDVSSGAFSASSQGVSDVGFLLQTNIFGGPALTREQFRSFVPQTFASFHLAVTTPLGTYDSMDALNPSANRWMFNPTINYVTRLTRAGHGWRYISRPGCSRRILIIVWAAPQVSARTRYSSSRGTRAAI